MPLDAAWWKEPAESIGECEMWNDKTENSWAALQVDVDSFFFDVYEV